MKILMVCLGNICRSPLAQGIMAEKIRKNDLDWTVDSAGTGNWHVGEQPDPRSVQTARRYGLDISDQRARQLRPQDLREFDLILAMDTSNYRHILEIAPEGTAHKVEMILNYVHPGRNQSVPDPYWNDDGFEDVYQLLDQATDRLIEACLAED